MIRLLADENFHGDVLRGILRVEPQLDVVRVQDTPLYRATDQVLLEWAAKDNRILLTHDVRTMTKYAYDRIRPDCLCLGSSKSAMISRPDRRSKKFCSCSASACRMNSPIASYIFRFDDDLAQWAVSTSSMTQVFGSREQRLFCV